MLVLPIYSPGRGPPAGRRPAPPGGQNAHIVQFLKHLAPRLLPAGCCLHGCCLPAAACLLPAGPAGPAGPACSPRLWNHSPCQWFWACLGLALALSAPWLSEMLWPWLLPDRPACPAGLAGRVAKVAK